MSSMAIGTTRLLPWNQAVQSISNLASCAQSCKGNFLTVPKGFAPSCNAPHPYYQQVLDAGCRPTTNHPRPTTLGWPFSLQEGAGSRGFMGIPADFGGRPTAPSRAGFALARTFFSPGRQGARGQSPQATRFQPFKIIGLRAYGSSGWIRSLFRDSPFLTRNLPTGGGGVFGIRLLVGDSLAAYTQDREQRG